MDDIKIYKELHIRMRHLSLFHFEDIETDDLIKIDDIANIKYKFIVNNTDHLSTMIHFVDKYKELL